MKDRMGNVLHIGETVTLSELTRPRYLIGKKGIVVSLGDTRVLIEVNLTIGTRRIRLEPAALLAGDLTIVNPILNASELRIALETYIFGALSAAEHDQIITSDQKDKLTWYFFDGE